jgi:hypothetical protein
MHISIVQNKKTAIRMLITIIQNKNTTIYMIRSLRASVMRSTPVVIQ